MACGIFGLDIAMREGDSRGSSSFIMIRMRMMIKSTRPELAAPGILLWIPAPGSQKRQLARSRSELDVRAMTA